MKRVAILANPAGGGGITRVILNLLKGLIAQEHLTVDLILDWAQGRPYLRDLPVGVRLIDLQARITGGTISSLRIVPPLVRYLRQEAPDLLLSHLTIANGIVPIAKKIALSSTYLALVEHLPLSQLKPNLPSKLLRRWLYPGANAVVAVSDGMARELERVLGLKSVRTIYNPVVNEGLDRLMQEPLDHPWFNAYQPPVILAMGRLTPQKDFITLIRAFAILRKTRLLRLLILGEGKWRSELEDLVKELGIGEDVDLPGFVENPYSYLSRAQVFVLSSRFEGLPTVLIEALACGCQVVSTDCPYGPWEILAEGKYGRLAPVGNEKELGEAIALALNTPIAPEILRKRSLDFTIAKATKAYLALLG